MSNGNGVGKMRIDELITREPFSELFPVEASMLATITASMKKNGYDDAFPIVAWKDNGTATVIDGHTRLRAAIEAGIDEVPVARKRFANDDEAFNYAVDSQRDRRSMTKAEIQRHVIRCIKAVDKRKASGERADLASRDARLPEGERAPKSSAVTAAIVKCSPATVERVRLVEEHGDPETIKAMEEGTLPIKAAAEKVQQERREAPGGGAPRRQRVCTPPCEGHKYGRMAIDALRSIKKNDLERERAFEMVTTWIKENK